MSTWEERMAANAAVRRRIFEAEERRVDSHVDHHSHLDGTTVYCSCGQFRGIITVAFGEDYDPAKLSCSECGAVGVVKLGS